MERYFNVSTTMSIVVNAWVKAEDSAEAEALAEEAAYAGDITFDPDLYLPGVALAAEFILEEEDSVKGILAREDYDDDTVILGADDEEYDAEEEEEYHGVE
jgi:hypothetical protein